jgi:IS6 family transposase
VAALPARNHPAQRAVVLPFGFASSLRRETRLQDWTHRYALSYQNLEEMMQERGVEVDHSTLNRWVLRYAPELDKRIRPHLKPANDSWRVDETYIKIKSMWKYLYRAVHSADNTLDFMLSATRDGKVAVRFFRKVLKAQHTQTSRVINVDKSAAYPVALETLKKRRLQRRPTS